MSDVKRKKGETFDSFFRRFQRRTQASGRVLQVKKIRFHQKDEKTNKRRASALRREEKRLKYEYEVKTGKHKDDGKKKTVRH